MFLESTYAENTKRKLVKVEVECLSYDRYNLTLLEISNLIDRLVAKYKCAKQQFHLTSESREVDEVGHYENCLVIYYEKNETDEEYLQRIKVLECKDIRNFLDCLGRYNVFAGGKEKMQEILDRSKHYKLAEWQQVLVDWFMGKKTEAEIREEAYQKGLKDGEKKYEELKKIMQKSLAGE